MIIGAFPKPAVPATAAGKLRHDHVVIEGSMATRAQLSGAGVTRSALAHAVARGRWQRLHPCVYLLHSGEPTLHERRQAALLYAGRASALDAATACAIHGLRSVDPLTVVHVVVPTARKAGEQSNLVIRRTTQPIRSRTLGGLNVLRLPEAVVAACLQLRMLDSVRALVAEAVQRRLVTVAALSAALDRAPRRGSGAARRALAEVESGVRSVPEADFRALVSEAGLPMPVFNARLYDAAGRWLADPDAYWAEAALVHETDSREWHLSPEAWERTMRRHARLSSAGLTVLHSSPRRIRQDRGALAVELWAAYGLGVRRGPAPGVTAIPLACGNPQ